MTQITSFGVGQTAKVIAALYLFIGIIVVVLMLPFMIMANSMAGDMAAGGMGMGVTILLMLLAPILYAVAAWIFTALGCLIYNFVAGKVGGIAVNLEA